MNLIFEHLNSIGLVLDIAGAIILFKYGIPEKIDKDGHTHLILDVDEDEIKKAKKYKLYSSIGLILLIIGFLLQLISNFISS